MVKYKNQYLQEVYGGKRIKEYERVNSYFRTLANNNNYAVQKRQLIVLSNGNVIVPPQEKIDFLRHKFVATIFYVNNKPYDALIYDPLREFTKDIKLGTDEDYPKRLDWGFVTGAALDLDKLIELGLTINQIDYLWTNLDW